MKKVIVACIGLSIGCLPLGCSSGSSPAKADSTVSDDSGASDAVADSSSSDTTQDSGQQADSAVQDSGTPQDTARDTLVEDTSGPIDTTVPTDIADTSTTDTGSTTLPPGLNGKPASEALPFPEISEVVDTTGTAVAKTAVAGKWTVIWFYPAASTFG